MIVTPCIRPNAVAAREPISLSSAGIVNILPIKDFLATKERIKKRNLDERSNFIDYQRQLAQEYEPVVASTKEMAEKITDQLIPIKEDL